MPSLNVSELNIVVAIFGGFIFLYGLISVLIKNRLFLGEALPAMVVGIALGPIAAKFLDSERWGPAVEGQTSTITLGLARVVICVQLIIAGFQLPERYARQHWLDLLLCLGPIMTAMWLCTAGCLLAAIPNLPFLSALVIASCFTPTDPVLSQAIAKGPFSDKYVARHLREIISAEAGANDGFGFPFLMLATYLLRHLKGAEHFEIPAHHERSVEPLLLVARSAEEVGRLGGGAGVAIKNWVVETWLYVIAMSVVIGALIGFIGGRVLKFALRRKWVDMESYLLFPTGIGLFLMGVCGLLGTNDLLACFAAGNAMNWDGEILRETDERHDQVNPSIDMLLNFAGFMYIGAIIPWSEFNQPELGLTWGRLFGLGFLVLVFRRIPIILASYKLMPRVCYNWKEALFMGYFGPIGIGAVFYAEHSRHLFPKPGEGDPELDRLVRILPPIVYFMVFFCIVAHGLSIPILSIIYHFIGIEPVRNDGVEVRRLSLNVPPPVNASPGLTADTFIAYNRFSRPSFNETELPVVTAAAETGKPPIVRRYSQRVDPSQLEPIP